MHTNALMREQIIFQLQLTHAANKCILEHNRKNFSDEHSNFVQIRSSSNEFLQFIFRDIVEEILFRNYCTLEKNMINYIPMVQIKNNHSKEVFLLKFQWSRINSWRERRQIADCPFRINQRNSNENVRDVLVHERPLFDHYWIPKYSHIFTLIPITNNVANLEERWCNGRIRNEMDTLWTIQTLYSDFPGIWRMFHFH